MSGLLTSWLLALAVAVMSAAGNDTTPFKITTKRDDDRVDVKAEKSKVTVSVYSPFGISQAVIERTSKTWPDAVVLRLHLKGLENFWATNGKVKLEASASLKDSKPVVRLWKDGRENAPLDAKSPYWMDIRILSAEGKQAKEIPLRGGYFEMQLPRALFEGNPKSITLNWIDFYRN
jgi:hypothetical protein